MKAQALIQELSCLDPNMEVYFAYPKGDYIGTIAAQKVDRVSIGDIAVRKTFEDGEYIDEEEPDADAKIAKDSTYQDDSYIISPSIIIE